MTKSLTTTECEYKDYPYCECEGKVKLRKAMTAYHFEGKKNSPEDPDRDFWACDSHYEEYADHWNEMWREYYRSVL